MSLCTHEKAALRREWRRWRDGVLRVVARGEMTQAAAEWLFARHPSP